MKFYLEGGNYFDDSLFAYGEHNDNAKFGAVTYCEECGSALSSRMWLPPYDVTISKYNTGDFIQGSVDLLVSDSFRLAYEKSGLIGLNNFERVNVYWNGKL